MLAIVIIKYEHGVMMKFETLSTAHLVELLDFETRNRSWFESMIAPRDNRFYTKSGVKQHIEETETLMANNVFYAGVLLNDKGIVARANLKDIEDGTAFVGYRVCQKYLSLGLASRCLTELIEQASQMGLKTLKGQVLDNNPASGKVLEKQGFAIEERISNFYQLNGQSLDCLVYRKYL